MYWRLSRNCWFGHGGRVDKRGWVPKTFEPLQDASHHIADRAWTGLVSFLTAQSVLVLAWAAILVVKEVPSRWIVMVGISVVGVLTGLIWSLLGTRMWDFHLAYSKQLERMAENHDRGEPDHDLSAWVKVTKKVTGRWETKNFPMWFVGFSGNHWVLFLSPLFFSMLHMVMIYVVLCCPLGGAAALATSECCATWRSCFLNGFGTMLVLYIFGAVVVCVQCLPILWSDDFRRLVGMPREDGEETGGKV